MSFLSVVLFVICICCSYLFFLLYFESVVGICHDGREEGSEEGRRRRRRKELGSALISNNPTLKGGKLHTI